jgi:hypothetical protein
MHRANPPTRTRFVHPVAAPALGPGVELDQFLRAYLAYVWNYGEDRFHPISTAVYQVLRSSHLSVLAEAMTLGPALERLVKTLYGHVVQAPADLNAELDSAMAALASCSLSQSTRNRVTGCIEAARMPSAADIFRALITHGVITRRDFKRWKVVRNAGSHGDEMGDDPARLAEDNSALVVTMYRLIMQAIGYEGKYLDWSSTSPMVHFAPKDLARVPDVGA